MDDVQSETSAVRLTAAPAPLWALVALAIAPFPVAAWLYAYGPATGSAEALSALLAWSLTVMAFLGGVRWGLETAVGDARFSRLAVALVCPVAAVALYLARGRLGDDMVVGGFLAAFLLQWLFDRAPDGPSRYPRLSTALTLAAAVSLGVVLEHVIAA